MVIPDTPTPAQEEILITLRALAGLVAQAVRQKVALAGLKTTRGRWRERTPRSCSGATSCSTTRAGSYPP